MATLSGVTRDASLQPVASAALKVFRSSDNTLVATGTSNASGNYSITVPDTGPFYVVGHKTGSPDISGSTISINAVESAQYATLNPSDKTTNMVLSQNNLRGDNTTSGATYQHARATIGDTTGKRFFSAQRIAGASTLFGGVGIVSGNKSLGGTYLGNDAQAWIFYSDGKAFTADTVGTGNLITMPTHALNAWIDVAADLDAKLIWFRLNGGNWNNSATANPATGVGGASFSGLTGSVFPVITCDENGVGYLCNFGATAFAYAPPSGFVPWGAAPAPGGGSITLNALTLSNSSVNENTAAGVVVGNIGGKSADTTLTITNTAGNRFTLDQATAQIKTGSVSTDYETATSHQITIRETYNGSGTATNSPRDTNFTITVNDVNEGGSSGGGSFPPPSGRALTASFTNGFESNLIGSGANDWDNNNTQTAYPNAVVQRVTTNPHSGSYCARSFCPAKTGETIPKASLQKTSPRVTRSGDITRTYQWVRINSNVAFSELYFWDNEDTGNGSIGMRLKWAAGSSGGNPIRIDREWTNPRAIGDEGNRNPVLPRNQWVEIMTEVYYHPSAGSVYVYYNGTEVFRRTNTPTIDNTFNQVENGLTANSGSVDVEMFWDDTVWQWWV